MWSYSCPHLPPDLPLIFSSEEPSVCELPLTAAAAADSKMHEQKQLNQQTYLARTERTGLEYQKCQTAIIKYDFTWTLQIASVQLRPWAALLAWKE